MINTTGLSLEEQVKALRAENERLKANKESKGIGIKVSPKGGVSVYGLGRFPLTLYSSQWSALNERMAEVMAFIEANKESLKTK